MSAILTEPQKAHFKIRRAARDETHAVARVRYQAAWFVLFAASAGFVAAGAYTVLRGWDAKDQVRAQLAAEHITTSDDASIPNAAVVNAETAQSEANVIRAHALEATGGKTYAQMERTDPARETAFNAAALRTALLSAVMAFNVANLAMGFGAFVGAIGLLGILSLILMRPRFVKTE